MAGGASVSSYLNFIQHRIIWYLLVLCHLHAFCTKPDGEEAFASAKMTSVTWQNKAKPAPSPRAGGLNGGGGGLAIELVG